jgi:hypothetical protein
MKATAILFGFFAMFAVGASARGASNPGLKAVADSSTDIAVMEVLDWPGTSSQPAAPLLSPSQSEANVRVLMVFDTGGTAREYAASAVTYVRIVDE